MAFEQQQKWADAAQAWKAVTVRNPSDAAAFASLGVDLARQQKLDEAAAAYRKALKLNPKMPGLQLNLGLAEFKQGHFSGAATAFRSALAADASNAQAQTLLGMSYYGAKKFDLASQYLERASKADPGNAELHQMLAQSCLWTKKLDCAQNEFKQLLQQSPDSAPTHVLMGEALDGLGRTPEAIAEFQAAAKISPKEPNRPFRTRLPLLEVAAVSTKLARNSRANWRSIPITPRPSPISAISNGRTTTPTRPSLCFNGDQGEQRPADRLCGLRRDLSPAETLQRRRSAIFPRPSL